MFEHIVHVNCTSQPGIELNGSLNVTTPALQKPLRFMTKNGSPWGPLYVHGLRFISLVGDGV